MQVQNRVFRVATGFSSPGFEDEEAGRAAGQEEIVQQEGAFQVAAGLFKLGLLAWTDAGYHSAQRSLVS